METKNKKQQVTAYCRQFKTAGINANIDQLIAEAESKGSGFWDFTLRLLAAEAQHRHHNEVTRRFKAARLPKTNDLDHYDHSFDNGLSKKRVNQLRELNWLDQLFNLMLMGPSGTGKTLLAAGLCAEAIKKGYKAYFRTMEEVLNVLKMKDFTRSALTDYKRLIKAQLIVIDDIMLFPVEKNQAVAFFHFINQLYENTTFIITTNKMPVEWAKMLDDAVLATALLDRLLYRCDIIKLSGKSYRMKNRKSFFENEN
jgi:DNA replication protein DnaC